MDAMERQTDTGAIERQTDMGAIERQTDMGAIERQTEDLYPSNTLLSVRQQ